MVVLFKRLWFQSYNEIMYKIIDKKTKWIGYEYKELFNNPTMIKIKDDVYIIIHKNGNLTEFHESMLPMIVEIQIPILKNNRTVTYEYKYENIMIHSYKELLNIYNQQYLPITYLNDSYLHLEKIPLGVKRYIKKINEEIKERCKDITILFDYCYKLNEPGENTKLCLQYKNKCISNVYYSEVIKKIKMDLYTIHEYQGKQYNILLCAIGIMISQYYDVKYIFLDCRNPITLYMFGKYYECEYDKNFTTFLGDQKITMELCNKYFEKINRIDINVVLNNKNRDIAKDKYYEIIEKNSKLTCP